MYAQVEKQKENKSRAVANSVTQKKSNGNQGFGFVDNRPEAIAQRPYINDQEVLRTPIQRLVITDGTDDPTVKSAIPHAEKQAGGPTEKWPNPVNLSNHTRIAIVAHGDTGTIGLNNVDMKGDELGAALNDRRLGDSSILFLWSCRAGVRTGVHGEEEHTSLVETTANALKEAGRMGVVVQGFKGIHFFMEETGMSGVINPDRTGGQEANEDRLMEDLMALNIHFIKLHGYFSEDYIAQGPQQGKWSEVEYTFQNGTKQTLFSIDLKLLTDETNHDKEEMYLAEKAAATSNPEWLNTVDTYKEWRRNKASEVESSTIGHPIGQDIFLKISPDNSNKIIRLVKIVLRERGG